MTRPRNSRNCHVAPLRMAVLLAVTSAASMNAHAVKGDQAEGEVIAHYVHLNGVGSDQGHKQREASHAHCVDFKETKGLSAPPLEAAGLPNPSSTIEIEIYYTANRTVTIRRHRLYNINWETCTFYKDEWTTRELDSGAGACLMDLTKQTARGHCDAAEHRRAAARKPLAIEMQPTPGASMKIAGHTCEVYASPSGDLKHCIARPKSDFPIPSSPTHSAHRGLLLKIDGERQMLADKVELHKEVPGELFSVPKNLKVTEIRMTPR